MSNSVSIKILTDSGLATFRKSAENRMLDQSVTYHDRHYAMRQQDAAIKDQQFRERSQKAGNRNSHAVDRMTELPTPPVPAEVDLRDFPWWFT